MLLSVTPLSIPQPKEAASGVTRAVLKNGLRVVIIRNPLAPVVTVEENYLAGGDETPEGFPGMAHAQEHMAFRGCAGLSGDQTAALYAQLGDQNNADTQQDKALLLRQLPLRESSEEAVAGGLLARARIGLPLDEPTRAAHHYFDLTAEQVRAAFKTWIQPNGFVEVVRGPAP